MYILIPVFTGILKEEHLENILLLQYAMFLIGGFSNEPVSNENVTESSQVLKIYVQQLNEFNTLSGRLLTLRHIYPRTL